MYKSQIDVFQKQIRLQYENDILKAVQEHAVHVDKEELLKALQYDREQYEKGFADGTRAIARILERLEEEIDHSPWGKGVIQAHYLMVGLHRAIEIIKEEVK